MDCDPHRSEWLRQHGVPRERHPALQTEGRHGHCSPPAQEHDRRPERPGPGHHWQQQPGEKNHWSIREHSAFQRNPKPCFISKR